VRGALDGLRCPAFAFVEGDPIQVEQKGFSALDELLAFLAGQQHFAPAERVLEIVGPGPGEDDGLAVGAPRGIALDQLRVVGAGQGAERLHFPVVDAENPLDREEQLREGQPRFGHEDGLVLDSADDVTAVGRSR